MCSYMLFWLLSAGFWLLASLSLLARSSCFLGLWKGSAAPFAPDWLAGWLDGWLAGWLARHRC